jgi:hypothetical protein
MAMAESGATALVAVVALSVLVGLRVYAGLSGERVATWTVNR